MMDSDQLVQVLENHYFKLCNTLTDTDDLLPHFVGKIISINELEEIKATVPTKPAKVHKLMVHMSGPLKGGKAEVFYTMLKIMDQSSNEATQQLADEIRKSIPVDVDKEKSDHTGKSCLRIV